MKRELTAKETLAMARGMGTDATSYYNNRDLRMGRARNLNHVPKQIAMRDAHESMDSAGPGFEERYARERRLVMMVKGAFEAGDVRTVRVVVLPRGAFDIASFDLDSNIDDDVQGHYDSADDLPDWVRVRLAVLSMLSPTPPTETIPEVGRRISERVYWVFRPEQI